MAVDEDCGGGPCGISKKKCKATIQEVGCVLVQMYLRMTAIIRTLMKEFRGNIRVKIKG